MLPRGGPKFFFGVLTRANCAPPKQKPSYAPGGGSQELYEGEVGGGREVTSMCNLILLQNLQIRKAMSCQAISELFFMYSQHYN